MIWARCLSAAADPCISPVIGDGRNDVSRLPFFLPNHQDLMRGMVMPQAGSGPLTVCAQIHAIAVDCVPSVSVSLGRGDR